MNCFYYEKFKIFFFLYGGGGGGGGARVSDFFLQRIQILKKKSIHPIHPSIHPRIPCMLRNIMLTASLGLFT